MATTQDPLLDEQELPDESADTTDDNADSSDPLEGQEDLQKALYGLYLKCCTEDRYARMMQLKDWQQACFYWRGLQYWWWSQREEQWNLPNQSQGLISPLGPEDTPRFQFVTNIYQAFGLSLIAVLSQAPPRTRFFPDDADVPADVETAEGYTKLAKIIERWNPIQVQLQDEAFHLWTGGLVGAWTRYIADGEKYGFETVNDLQSGEEVGPDQVQCAGCGFMADADTLEIPGNCPQCGQPLTEENIIPGQTTQVPDSGGESEVPQGREIVTIVGAGNLKCPAYAQDQSDCHYFGFEEEIHYAKLRAAHPDIADKIKPGGMIGDDNGFERNARLAVQQGTNLQMQTGEASSVLTTYARVWFRPTAFWSDAVKKEHRERLLELFPRGCRVNFAGPEYCESEAQSVDDCWVTAHAMPGNGWHRPALGTSMISVQDRYNTDSNIEQETYEYEIPRTFLAADTYSDDAVAEMKSEPGAIDFLAVPAGADIRARAMQLAGNPPSAAMLQSMDKLMGPVAQFLTGAFPALLGAGAAQGAAGDTAAGYKMQMDQALGRCGISYVRLKQFHADQQTLACKDFCEHSTGKAKISVLGDTGDFETEAVDVTALEGNCKAHPEGDENFPELWNQQREFMKQIMDSPQGAALAQDPKNAQTFVKLIGIPGLQLPGAAANRKTLKIIGKLTELPEPGQGMLSEGPLVTPPIPPATLIIPAIDTPIAAQIAQSCLDWLINEEGQKCAEKNPPGFENVMNYMVAIKALVPKAEPEQKPLSETFTTNYKDLPPEAQAQILEQMGIQVSPQDFIAQVALEQAKKSRPQTGATPGQPAQPGNQAQPGPGA